MFDDWSSPSVLPQAERLSCFKVHIADNVFSHIDIIVIKAFREDSISSLLQMGHIIPHIVIHFFAQ
jgi:hypothetical protein